MQVPGGLWYNFHVGEDYTDHLVCIVFWERLGVGSTGAFLCFSCSINHKSSMQSVRSAWRSHVVELSVDQFRTLSVW